MKVDFDLLFKKIGEFEQRLLAVESTCSSRMRNESIAKQSSAFKQACDDIAAATVYETKRSLASNRTNSEIIKRVSEIVQAILRRHMENDDSTPA